jgi:hypothetical protein
MRFKPHEQVIDLLVGQRLYTSSDAAIRELLQNAEDACALQTVADPSYEPRIVVRFSVSGGWVEVVDNGLGMNEEALDLSFSSVGAPKDQVEHIRELLDRAPDQARQIALFGIGVLSCFGVALGIELRTKMDEHHGLAFRIPNHHEEWEPLANAPSERGTSVRLELMPDGPMRADEVPVTVERFARHAAHVEVEDIDAQHRRAVPERWQGADAPGAVSVSDPAARAGFLALDPRIDDPNRPLRANLMVCNGGFLVRELELQLIHPYAVGYLGEIDVQPGALAITLNREDFQHDEPWQEVGQRLLRIYNDLIRARLDEWEKMLTSEAVDDERPALERTVLVLLRGPTNQVLEADIIERLERLLPDVVQVKVWDKEEVLSVREVLGRATSVRKVCFVREDAAARQFQQSLAQGARTVQLTEIAQTTGLRAGHLQAKGAVVLSCRPRNYAAEFGGSTQNISMHDADLISFECQKAGLSWVAVEDASPEEVALDAAPESMLFTSLLDLGEELKLVGLPGSDERVIRDFAGRLLNASHSEVREILQILPDAVGNPVRKALLQAYMDIESFALARAQERIKELLLSPDLSQEAQLEAGKLLREYLRAKLAELIARDERSEP